MRKARGSSPLPPTIMEKIQVIYQDEYVLVVDKPAGLVVFPEDKYKEKTLIDYLIADFPDLKRVGNYPRYGIVHRLDKDTSGILLVAKNNESLEFFQKQFQNSQVEKKYLALIVGNLKNKEGEIDTLIDRSPNNRKKQKVYLENEPESQKKNLRKALTKYRVITSFNGYDLVEVKPLTGRKHQIRVHLAYLNHPIANDKLYGFKNQACPKGLKRQFLHSSYLKIKLPNNKEKEFNSELPEELKEVIKTLK